MLRCRNKSKAMKTSRNEDLASPKDRITAVSGTIILLVLIFVVAIIFGFKSTTSVTETEGAYVLLGTTEFGSPGESAPQYSDYQPEPSQPATSQPVVETPVISQQVEETPVTVPKAEEKKTNQVQNTEPAKEEKKANPKFQFQSGNTGGQKGNTETPGDQGSKTGNPDAYKYGTGGGSGYSFNLSGRTVLLAPPKIEDNSQQTARIVIEIGVNRNGTVISATPVYKYGATTAVGPLAEKAAAAAMKVKFSPNPDANEVQYGTITFNFKLN